MSTKASDNMSAKAGTMSPAVAQEPEYDVAISFLGKDQRIAGELAERLAESLKVFYYPRSQEQLAGTDGMESMRVPFVSGARVVVVLYREPWGATEWTRLEESAIKDGCLQRGWSTLMFVQLDKTSKLPVWLPHTHVRFVLEDYGIDQLIGAIKARVQEHGGTVAKPDAIGRARRIQREAEFLAEKQRLFRDRAWIEQTVQRSVWEAMQRAVELVNVGGKAMQPPPITATQNLFCVMTDERVSVAAGWKQGIFNDVGREANVFIREFRGAVAIPGSSRMYVFTPQLRKERKFTVELTATHELAWVENGKKELLSTEDLAHTIAMAYFDLIGKVNRGEIEMPFA
jgi:hypothetical protein